MEDTITLDLNGVSKFFNERNLSVLDVTEPRRIFGDRNPDGSYVGGDPKVKPYLEQYVQPYIKQLDAAKEQIKALEAEQNTYASRAVKYESAGIIDAIAKEKNFPEGAIKNAKDNFARIQLDPSKDIKEQMAKFMNDMEADWKRITELTGTKATSSPEKKPGPPLQLGNPGGKSLLDIVNESNK